MIDQIEEYKSKHAKETARRASGSNSFGGEIPSENETKDTAAEVDDSEADATDGLLHFPAHGELQEHVEGNVYDAGVQEHGDDEPEPLIGILVVYASKATKSVEVTLIRGISEIRGGDVRTGPGDGRASALNLRVGAHAGDETGAHVDEDVGGRADHGIESGTYHDGGTGDNAVADDLDNEDSDIDKGGNVANPSDATREKALLLLFTFGQQL